MAAASRSVAVASRAHTSPAQGGRAFALGDDELEYGVGIHGERAARTVTRPPLEELVDRRARQVLDGLPRRPEDVLLLVGGPGATTLLELYAVQDRVRHFLDENGVRVAGQLVGTFVPALDMSGFSLTLTTPGERWVDWWHAPARTPAFPVTRPFSVSQPFVGTEPTR